APASGPPSAGSVARGALPQSVSEARQTGRALRPASASPGLVRPPQDAARQIPATAIRELSSCPFLIGAQRSGPHAQPILTDGEPAERLRDTGTAQIPTTRAKGRTLQPRTAGTDVPREEPAAVRPNSAAERQASICASTECANRSRGG